MKIKPLSIITHSGMLNIESKDISYGNIKKMYITGSGYGLQLSGKFEHKREEIVKICGEIANKVYDLQDILSA